MSFKLNGLITKNLFITCLVLFLIVTLSSFSRAATYTSVSATLMDGSGQTWVNASYRVELIPPFGNPNTPTNQGTPVTGPFTGFANGSGAFSVTLDDNTIVTPSGSTWKFTLCPNATVAVCSTSVQVVHGASMNLSASLSADLTPITVGTSPTIFRAYQDSEAFGGQGALYWRTLDNTLRGCTGVCNGNNWVNVGGGGGGGTVWGTITGVLSDQTDLQSALNTKVSLSPSVDQVIGNGHNLTLAGSSNAFITPAIQLTGGTANLLVCLDSSKFLVTSGCPNSGTTPFTVFPTWWTSGDGTNYSADGGATGLWSTGTANQIKFWMTRIPYTIVVNTISWRHNTSLAGSHSALGLYNATGTTKIFSVDNFNTNVGAGPIQATLGAPVTIQPGVYILASGTDTTGASPGTQGGFRTAGTSDNTNSYNIDTARSGMAANTLSGGAMPASLGALSTSTTVGTDIPSFTMVP